jgi:PAS domain S-box-containing protein
MNEAGTYQRIERELRIRARQQETVAQLGQLALQGVDLNELMQECVQRTAQTLEVELCKVLQLSPEGDVLTLIAGVGWNEGLVGKATVGAGLDSQAGYTLQSNDPIIVEDLREETRFDGPSLLHEHGVTSGASVIIQRLKQPYGVLGVHTREKRLFTKDDVAFLQSVANVLGSAITRIESEEALRLSRDQLEIILQGVADGITVQDRSGKLVYANQAAARLMGLSSPEDIHSIPVPEILKKFVLLTADGQPFPLEELPGRRIMAGELAVSTTLRFRVVSTGEDRWSAVRSRPVFDEAGKVQYAINIFQDVTEMVQEEQSQRLLAKAGQILASSLDYRSRLTDLAKLVVPQMADWCAIHMYDEHDGTINNLVVAHVDERKWDLAERLQRRYPPQYGAEYGVGKVLATGEPELIGEVTDEALVLAARDEEHLELLRTLQLRSGMIVPMVARGRTIGAITFVWAESGRFYSSEEDLKLAQEMADRAALAIDNARLYQEAQSLNQELEARVMRRTEQMRSMINMLKDEIADRKRAEEAVRANEVMLYNLFESSPNGIVITNAEGQIVMVNEQVEVMFGYVREELIGQPVDMLLPEGMRSKHIRHRRDYVAKPALRPMGAGIELFGRRKDGAIFPVDVMLSPVETSEGTLVISAVRDITERKQSEAALRERDELLRAAVTGAPIALLVVNRDGTIKLSLGKGLEPLWQMEDIVGRPIQEVYWDWPELLDKYQRALAGESFTSLAENAGLVFEIHFAPLRSEEGEITGVASVATDITDRKRAEEALRQSETRFRTIFEEAEIGISIMDLQGRWLDSNPAVERMLGYTNVELRRMSFWDVSLPEQSKLDMRLLKELVSGKRSHYTMEKLYRCKDGHLAWGHLTVSLVRDEAGEPEFAIALVEDVTERKQMEVELEELSRRLMESAEQERLHLAQELHDGPLQELHGATYQIQGLSLYLQDEDNQVQLAELRSTLQSVIKDLRSLCRELRPPTLAPFGLEKAILSHAEAFLEKHPHIRLQLNLDEDGQKLPERIRLALFRIYQQALNNIVKHAEANSVEVCLNIDNGQVKLEVVDDGRGFEVPTRWIELARQGHLGLVGALERAESIGGKLQVESSPGLGTSIRVMVPIDDEEKVRQPA